MWKTSVYLSFFNTPALTVPKKYKYQKRTENGKRFLENSREKTFVSDILFIVIPFNDYQDGRSMAAGKSLQAAFIQISAFVYGVEQ